MLGILEKIARNPYLSLVAGTVLLLTSGWEIVQSLGTLEVGAHHGVAFYGLLQMLRSIPEIAEGSKDIVEAKGAH